jgi:hypothetical protein
VTTVASLVKARSDRNKEIAAASDDPTVQEAEAGERG